MPANAVVTTKTEDLKVRVRQTVFGEQTAAELAQRKPPKSEGVVVEDGVVSRAPVISIDDIYRAPEAGTKIGLVLRLLREAARSCDNALAALQNSDPISADNFML